MPDEDILTPQYTLEQIEKFNAELDGKSPQEILEWAIDNCKGLYQTTAFGLTGTAALDMVSKISLERESVHLVPLIFLDTLHHFPETVALAQIAAETYIAPLHVYTPQGVSNSEEFAAKYGDNLWETDEASYDYLVKVEPAARAYKELGVKAVITGRRRSQGADRADLKVLEVDERGLIKVNPLIGWTFKEVKEYVDKEQVPYNPLLEKGYKSIGDVHSTAPPDPNAISDYSERSGRWQGKSKTECGLHCNYFEMKKKFEEKTLAEDAVSKEQV
ncbi:phosphoadenosine phosphosulfate reductase [Cryptococcus depauperatus CBS 7841]|uniref:Phosphoadenosine phosphosulfate reductase n=1 Tax=Cryptococcus depauperatus CBS 7841 TaxID=1295531 RepID=A0A1E3IJN9_9TREE|nr:phosphoadenosine phosphosulfate reductase [Cryptococcus depauperatus CBS 7841]